MRLATWDCVQQAALLAFPLSAGGAAPPPALPTLTSRNTDYQRRRKKQDCQDPKDTLECAAGAGWLHPFWNRTHGSPGAPLSLSEPLPGTSSYSLSSAPSTQLTPAYSPVSGWTNHWVPKQLPLPSGPHQAGSLQEKPHPRKASSPTLQSLSSPMLKAAAGSAFPATAIQPSRNPHVMCPRSPGFPSTAPLPPGSC